jgi:hypothetical protein
VALPWLAELATQELIPDRHQLLVMIADLVSGDHRATAATRLDQTLAWVAESANGTAARTLRQTLWERLPRLLELAKDIAAPIRAAAPLVLTLLPRGEALVRPVLEAALADETVPEARASALLGLGRLDRYAKRAPSRAGFDDPAPLVAGAARLAALMADPAALADEEGPLAAEHAAALVAFARSEADPERFPWHRGQLVALAARVFCDCMPEGGIALGEVLARQVRDAGFAEDAHLAVFAEAAVRMALTGRHRRRHETLDPRQWRIVADLSRRDFDPLEAAWRAAGMPIHMGERRTLVVRHRGRI